MIIVKKVTTKDASQTYNINQTTLLNPDSILEDPDKRQYGPQDEIDAIKNRDNLYLAAWFENQVVGICKINRGLYRKNSHVGTLELFIRPEYRRQGIASRLIKDILHLARKESFKKVEIEVWENNKSAALLYDKFDFEVEGKRKKAYKIRGRYIDSVIMAKIL